MIPMRRTALPLALALVATMPATVFAHGSLEPAPTFPSVLLDWRFDPLAVVLLVVTAAAYLWAVRTVNRAHPRTRSRGSGRGCSWAASSRSAWR